MWNPSEYKYQKPTVFCRLCDLMEIGKEGKALLKNRRELKQQVAEVWRLSLPAILTQITTIAMQYIDSAMVGDLGANASAAIGLVSTSTWLLSGMIYAVSAGFSVQVAHEIGAENDIGARSVVKHGLWAALVVSGLSCLLGVALSGPLPVWLGGE